LVTGSRIRRSDYTSPTPTPTPTPTTTVDGEYLRDLGLVSVGEVLTQNPTNVSRTGAEVWMSVNNLWDKDPPFSAGGTGGVNGVFCDTLGRSYRMGGRLNF
jgi:hypothetical protein